LRATSVMRASGCPSRWSGAILRCDLNAWLDASAGGSRAGSASLPSGLTGEPGARNMTQRPIEDALEKQGITNFAAIHHNLPTSFLYEEIVRRREGRIAHLGPVVVRTGHHTGRAPNDKFVVREPSSEKEVWWGSSNQPLPPERFDALKHRLLAYLQGKDLFVQD